MHRPKFVIALLLALAGLAAAPAAKDWWNSNSSYQTWNPDQVKKLLNDSPWAQGQPLSDPSATASQGTNEITNNFTVRLFSARPIREAYVRLLEIMNKYDEMPAEQKTTFDSRVQGILAADVRDEVVVTVAYTSNDQQVGLDLKQFFGSATQATLSQQAYLYTPKGRFDLAKYFPPGQEGIGARFIFPRLANGKPVFESGDKEMRFELWVNPIGQKLLVGFKGSKMMYKGELAF